MTETKVVRGSAPILVDQIDQIDMYDRGMKARRLADTMFLIEEIVDALMERTGLAIIAANYERIAYMGPLAGGTLREKKVWQWRLTLKFLWEGDDQAVDSFPWVTDETLDGALVKALTEVRRWLETSGPLSAEPILSKGDIGELVESHDHIPAERRQELMKLLSDPIKASAPPTSPYGGRDIGLST